jgi:uncharacterized protein YwgA
MTVSDKIAQAYLRGADDGKKQARKELEEQFSSFELEELRDLADDQARIIASMQKQRATLMEQLNKFAVSKFAEDESDVEQLSKQGR